MPRFRYLKPEEVEVRVGQCSDKGCSLLLYKTSRTDMTMLDEQFGSARWQCDYKSIDGKLYCGIGVLCVDEEYPEHKQWVWKWDTGVESNMEAQKGEASDAFKRAGFKWGIGRELYTAPRIWVGPEKCHLKQGNNGRLKCFDDFRVTEMEVEDGRIVKLCIANMSMKGQVVYGAASTSKSEKPVSDDLKAAQGELNDAIKQFCKKTGSVLKDISAGVQKRPEWEEQKSSAEYLRAVAREFRDAS